MGEKWDKFKDKLETKSLTSLDTKTVLVLDNAIRHLKTRANDKNKDTKPSEAAIKKLNVLAEKYTLQKGKTIALYNKHKKKNPILRGLSVSSLSVQKIYDVLGKNTKQAGPLKEAWLNDPGKVLQIAGAGLATAGAVSALAGTGIPKTLFEIIKGFFANSEIALALRIGVGALGAGALIFAGGMAIKKHQKSRAIYLSEQQKAEEAMNKGSVKDEEHMSSKLDADAITKLASEASIDSDLMVELQSIISDPLSNPIAANNAITILNQAKSMQEENFERSNGMLLQNKIESAANESDEIKNYAIALRAKELCEKTKAPKTIDTSNKPLMDLLGIEDAEDANKFITDFINNPMLTDDFINENFKTVADFETYIKNDPKYESAIGGYTGSGETKKPNHPNLKNHIITLARQKFEATQARTKLLKMRSAGNINYTDIPNAEIDYKTVDITINGKSKAQVETDGISKIVKLAEDMGITLVGSDDSSKFESLKKKYGDKTGVMQALESIQKDQLKLEGTRELGSE